MNMSKWPPIDYLDPLIDIISERLIVVEEQLDALSKIKETGYYDCEEMSLVDLLQENLELELEIQEFMDQLRFWDSQEKKTSSQQSDIRYAHSRLNRLSIVNVNIILVCKRFLEQADTAETVVSAVIKRLQHKPRYKPRSR